MLGQLHYSAESDDDENEVENKILRKHITQVYLYPLLSRFSS